MSTTALMTPLTHDDVEQARAHSRAALMTARESVEWAGATHERVHRVRERCERNRTPARRARTS